MKPFLHDHLTRSLLVEIASGGHRELGRFLSRRRIEAIWGVSRPTVESALSRLEAFGVLRIRERRAAVLEAGAVRKACLLLNQAGGERVTVRKSWTARRARLKHSESVKGFRLAIIVDHRSPQIDQLTAFNQSVSVEEEISPSSSDRYIASFVGEANRHFCETDMLVYENTPESAREILKAVRTRDIAGVAVFRRLLFGTPFQPLFEELHKAGAPVLAALNDCEGAADASVNFNEAAGGYEAMQQLIENGHRKILIVHGPLQRNQIEQRCQGALDYLRDHNLSGRIHLESYRVHHYAPEHLRGIMDILRPRRRNRPTAMLCPAMHIFKYLSPWLRESGIRIPRNLSVINIGNSATYDPVYGYTDIIQQDLREIGRIAALHLIQMAEGVTSERTVLVDMPYVPRKTIRRRRA